MCYIGVLNGIRICYLRTPEFQNHALGSLRSAWARLGPGSTDNIRGLVAWKRTGMCARFWWESQKERDHLEDQSIYGKMGSEWIVGRLAGGV
jgi:hypothetical protein